MTDINFKKDFGTRCIDLDLAPKVMMDGPMTAEYVILGQSPGHQEVAQKSPMVGSSGQLLWTTLRKFGLLRTDFYITNVVKRPVSVINGKENITEDELLKWRQMLQWELEQLPNVKYIFALGNYALTALLGKDKISDYRGSVIDYQLPNRKVQVLYSFNPAAVLRRPEDEIIFQFDARRFGQLVKGDWRPHPVEVLYDLSFKDSIDAIRYYRAIGGPIAVDLETPSRATACVGLSNDRHQAICFNFRSTLENRFTPEQELRLFGELQDLYEDPNVFLVAQNGSFDAQWAGYQDRIRLPIKYDTLLAHHTLYPQLPHSLQFLTSTYTTMPYYKGEYDEWREGTADITTLWKYNGKDCAATIAAYEGTRAELEQQGLLSFFYGHVMRAQPHLVRSTIDGMATDPDIQAKVAADLTKDVEASRDRFYQAVHIATGDDSLWPNPNSAPQLKDLLYTKLHLKHRSGSTDEDARKAMMADPRTSEEAKNVIAALNKFKTDYKFLSTYGEERLDTDGRTRCDWKQYGTQSAPGRLSSAKTLWGVGGNMQNKPPKARQFYVADEGCVLIYYDLAQAEARVVAYLADIEQWKEDFERARLDGSYDCHRALAAEMFKVPYNEVPLKDEVDGEYTIRYIAKRCRHGLNYRMGISRLAEVTELSHSRAANAYHLYHRITPELQKWWAATDAVVRRERALYNAFGRRLKIMQRLDDEALEAIVAFHPQSTIGDKNTQVWYQCHEDDRWDTHKAMIRLNVHDSLIGVASPSYAMTALSIMRKYAEHPIRIENVYRTKVEELIIPAETKISTLEIRDKKGNLIGMDTHHRWSNLKTVQVDKAA